MNELDWLEMLARLAAASFCGLIVGWDREARHKPAGLRTMMLVCLGAASFTLITLSMFNELTDQSEGGRLDPVRVVDGVIGGIGFLGAGSIIQGRGSVSGVTTAATIWVVGALGIACGLGLYVLALMTLVFATTILVLVGFVQNYLGRRTDLIPEREETGDD